MSDDRKRFRGMGGTRGGGGGVECGDSGLEMGDLADAARELEGVRKLQPANQQANMLLADTWLQLGLGAALAAWLLRR